MKYTIIHIYRSRGYCNICVNTKILSCVLIARSISVEIKTCLQYILYTMSRPYSAHDLRWRMVYQRLFYQRRYKEIASQLFVCPKTVYRTITFLNSGDVKPYRLGQWSAYWKREFIRS